MIADALSPLEHNVIRIARNDARRQSFLAGSRSRRPLANPRLEALRRYSAARFAGVDGAPERLALAGFDETERATIDASIARASAPSTVAREARVRQDRLATATGIGIALASITAFAGLNVMMLTGTY